MLNSIQDDIKSSKKDKGINFATKWFSSLLYCLGDWKAPPKIKGLTTTQLMITKQKNAYLVKHKHI